MVEQSARVQDTVVSFDSEPLILVDDNDRVQGHASKDQCHQGDGLLHRAFSLFIFNHQGDLLIHRRSQQKMLWPGFWTNSCCSHPRQGEDMDDAARRRLQEELGIRTELHYLYKFKYQADFGEVGSEHEMCSVYIGRSSDPVTVNINEIAEWRFIPTAELDADLVTNPDHYTPWFKMEWQQLNHQYRDQLDALLQDG